MFNRKARKFKKLRKAVAANDPNLADIGYFGGEKCFEAAKLALEGDAPRVFAALVKTKARNYNTSFAFANGVVNSKDNACRLLRLIDDKKHFSNAPLYWAAMHQASLAAELKEISLSGEEFLTACAPVDFILQQLQQDPSLFDKCLHNTAADDTEKLKIVLSLAPQDGSAHGALANALIHAAEEGHGETVALLLAHGADAQYANGLAATRAEENNHKDVAEMIRAGGKKAAATKKAKTDKTPEAAPDMTQTDTLVETESLPDGGTLTTIFNFRTRQQHNALHLPDGAAMMTTVSFKEIDKDVSPPRKRNSPNNKNPPTAISPRRTSPTASKAPA